MSINDFLPTDGSCNLISTSGIIVQGLLAFISFCVLIYKRFTERPKRVLKIWFLDVSKQILSQLITHIGNVVFAMIIASNYLSSKSSSSSGPD